MTKIGATPPFQPQQPQGQTNVVSCAHKLKAEVKTLITSLNDLTPGSANDPDFLADFANTIKATAALCKEAKNA
jgi:hypothetical protein